MKLKEMTTGQAADALVRIAEPAAEIINVDKVFKVFKNAGKLRSADAKKQIAFIVREVAPLLLDKHRNAVYAVLSIMTGKTEQEIDQQPIIETIKDINNSVDADLLGFFTPSGEQTSGSATE